MCEANSPISPPFPPPPPPPSPSPVTGVGSVRGERGWEAQIRGTAMRKAVKTICRREAIFLWEKLVRLLVHALCVTCVSDLTDSFTSQGNHNTNANLIFGKSGCFFRFFQWSHFSAFSLYFWESTSSGRLIQKDLWGCGFALTRCASLQCQLATLALDWVKMNF